MPLRPRLIGGWFALGVIMVSPLAMTQPAPPAASAVANEHSEAKAPGRYFVGRMAALGWFREIFDLSAYAAGLELSLGAEGARHGGHGAIRVSRGETAGGLPISEYALLGNYEVHFSALRFGAGGAATWLKIQRVTGKGSLDGLGIEAFVRVGYDLGELSGPYLMGQFEVGSLNIWGPTAYLGYRF